MSYQQVTLADLQASLSFSVEAKPFFTAAEMTNAINEGLRLYSCATGLWTRKSYCQTVPNDHYVPLDGSITQATRVLYNGRPLEKCSKFEFDYALPNWRAITTATAGAPPRPVYWAPIALTLIVIYPADAEGLNTLEVAGVRSTPILVNPGDFVDLGQEEHDGLLAYAQHVLSFKVGADAIAASMPGYIGFLKNLAGKNRQFAASAFYRRLLGLDQQRVLRPQTVPVENPVDRVLQRGGG